MFSSLLIWFDFAAKCASWCRKRSARGIMQDFHTCNLSGEGHDLQASANGDLQRCQEAEVRERAWSDLQVRRLLLCLLLLIIFNYFNMIVFRKKPNTKCKSIPHQVCELVIVIFLWRHWLYLLEQVKDSACSELPRETCRPVSITKCEKLPVTKCRWLFQFFWDILLNLLFQAGAQLQLQ